MANDNQAAEAQGAIEPKGKSQFEQRATQNAGLVSEMLGFLGKNKKWWLLPFLVTMLLFGVVLLLSGTAAAPFIYTFF
ncbi:Hypothetical protein A7982_02779 [Minicystis rosea]|nr:Hypothetical protein A7982_02779 [Minicystis rosea]